MDKNQTSKGAHASVLSGVNRPLFWARLFLLVMFPALSVMSLQPKTSQAADQRLKRVSLTSHQSKAVAPGCSEDCQQAYVQCLASGGHFCGVLLDDCLSACPSTR
jgi:hypothetical protein